MYTRFSLVNNGYDPIAVEALIQEKEYELHQQEKYAQSMSGMFIQTRAFANELIKNAEKEADAIIINARADAARIMQEAETDSKNYLMDILEKIMSCNKTDEPEQNAQTNIFISDPLMASKSERIGKDERWR